METNDGMTSDRVVVEDTSKGVNFSSNFIYVFSAVPGLRCCVLASPLQGSDFSLWWLLLLQSTGSRCMDFRSCGSRA